MGSRWRELVGDGNGEAERGNVAGGCTKVGIGLKVRRTARSGGRYLKSGKMVSSCVPWTSGPRWHSFAGAGTHLMTHPAKTSRTPSMPPLPCTPPDTPVLPQMGAIGRRMVALNWTNSELSSAGVEEVRRRDEVDAVGGAMVVRVGWEDSLGVLGSF